MERPVKKEYDFNDHFEAVRFASNMQKYADSLEKEIKALKQSENVVLDGVSKRVCECGSEKVENRMYCNPCNKIHSI